MDYDYAKACLIYTLSKDYHQVAQAFKWLRANPDADAATKEPYRVAATGWFNHVFVLWVGQFIDEAVLKAIASKTAAQLWCDLVSKLDYQIRVEKHNDPRAYGTHPVEQFWGAYARGELLVSKDPTAEPPADPSKETTH